VIFRRERHRSAVIHPENVRKSRHLMHIESWLAKSSGRFGQQQWYAADEWRQGVGGSPMPGDSRIALGADDAGPVDQPGADAAAVKAIASGCTTEP
jgi:hypothetical protein